MAGKFPILNGQAQTGGGGSSSEGGVAPAASTEFGHLYHLKVECVGGGAGLGNVNWGRKIVPPGTWEIVGVWFVLKGNGTTGDSVGCYVSSPVSTWVTHENIDISSNVEHDRIYPTRLVDGVVVTGNGSTMIMASTQDSNAGNAPPFDMHVLLRQTAAA